MFQNLAQYLSEEQKKMMDLWTELQRLRKQLSEYKERTEHDLENQKNEIVTAIRNVGGLRQLNLTGVEVRDFSLHFWSLDYKVTTDQLPLPSCFQPSRGGGIGEPLLSEIAAANVDVSGTTINQDTILIEAIRRFRESQAPSTTKDLELIKELKLSSSAADKDLYDELMKKYVPHAL